MSITNLQQSIWENIFLINLERRTDRLHHATQQFLTNGFSLSRVRKWKALDAALLCQKDPNCYKEILTPKAFQEFRQKTKTYHEQLSVGAVGCFLTHIQIWESIVQEHPPASVIFEDDLYFVKNFRAQFDQKWPTVPSDWDLVFLGSWHRRKPTKINRHVTKAKDLFLTHAYAIQNRAAEHLLKNVFPLKIQLDSYISSFFDRLNIYCLQPALVTQKKFKTDVQIPFARFHKIKSFFQNRTSNSIE